MNPSPLITHSSPDPKCLAAPSSNEQLELSVVMPCLNEAETVGRCVRKALATLQEAGIAGEVIVADNGSTDGSVEIAETRKARGLYAVSERAMGTR